MQRVPELQFDGRRRVVIEGVTPSVDEGRFPAKRAVGDVVHVEADIFADGHDVLAAELLWRAADEKDWQRAPLVPVGNDRWRSTMIPKRIGRHLFTIEAWRDEYATLSHALEVKHRAGIDVASEIADATAHLARLGLDKVLATLSDRDLDQGVALLTGAETRRLVAEADDRALVSRPEPIAVEVERPQAEFASWYELFPRSLGTFDDVIKALPRIRDMGFDVLYFPPIHPIGITNRKGRNNALKAGPDDPGSFYAIGNEQGGHEAVHPELGTLADFARLVETCREHKMEIAIDFAVQCSPDHPWLEQHPEWFRVRPDGTIRYAENPPKKYEDIVNPDFTCPDRIALWVALRDIILLWVGRGVRIFRVDNPHTKPLPFWEWLIREVRAQHPDVIFLAEAFTRPKIMKSLAKIGFSQSYTYFTWRTGKEEIQAYLSELTRFPERDYYRPNFFVTTPDILPIQLQTGETWLFKARAALAALLSSNYGIYNGFELIEHEPIPGREEYLNSEKYEIRTRDWSKPGNIKDYLQHINTIRRANPALLQTANLRFLLVDDANVIGFIKESVDGDNAVAVAIALSDAPHEFWLHFGAEQIGPADAKRPVRLIENLLTGERHMLEWGGIRLRINPSNDPALVFRCHA